MMAMEEVYDIVESAIDSAFTDQKFLLKFYEYLKDRDTKRVEVLEFIQSPTAKELNDLINDLDGYIEGGSDNMHKQLREGYGYIPKPQARKIRNYFESFLNDAQRYSNDRKPGRKKRITK
jgi:hypothetical protein